MATLKCVYFCDSDPDQWFENSADAEREDKKNEVGNYVEKYWISQEDSLSNHYKVIRAILERYDITERWDYKSSHEAEDVQE